MKLIKRVKYGGVRYLTSSLRWQIVKRQQGWVVEPCLRWGDKEAAACERRLRRAGLSGRGFKLRREAVYALKAMLDAERSPSALSQLL